MITLRCTPELHEALIREALDERISLNRLLTRICEEHLRSGTRNGESLEPRRTSR